MSRFVDSIKSSLELFARHPKFIVPKLLIAGAYSVLLLYTADISLLALEDPSLFVLTDLALLFFSAVVMLIFDTVVSSMYPFMAVQAQKGNVSLRKAFSEASSRFSVVLPSALAVEFGFLAITFIVSIPLGILYFVSEAVYIVAFSVVYAALLLSAVFFFYPLLPVASFEKISVKDSLKRSINLSLKNKWDVAKVTLLSAFLSLLSYALAFAIEFFPQEEGTLFFWAAFIIVRFATAYVYSYLYVLNPLFYFELVKKK
ncbi:MAG: hypothetical protein COV47_00035 [Candidatus Diapherotrites archaeon CG11_big_fil_rev_8_21_14_0_20_37_9]|nr:MAG: hypothetical protein COV47_00035 [Candidatus Diapherotrites archaeon CG11_big_fil_rev_8_21_14_0_20_37_9]